MHEAELYFIRQLQETLRGPLLDLFFLGWNFVDTFGFAIILIGVIWYLVNRQIGIRLFYILCLSSILNWMLKHWFALPRPCHVDPAVGLLCFSSPGFPSGAAQTAILLSGILFIECKNNLYRCLGVVFAFFLCFSRVYLGVHYFTDILGGLIVGGLLLIVYQKLFPLLQKHWKILSLLFPFFVLLVGRSAYLPLFGISLGTAVGLLLGQKQEFKNKNRWMKALEAFTAILGAFLLLKGKFLMPELKILPIFACGLWFSFLGTWILQKTFRNFNS